MSNICHRKKLNDSGAENLTKIKENLVVENRLLKERSSLVGNGLKGGVQRKVFFISFLIFFCSYQRLFLFLRNLKEKSSSSPAGNGVQRKVELVQESRIGHHFIF